MIKLWDNATTIFDWNKSIIASLKLTIISRKKGKSAENIIKRKALEPLTWPEYQRSPIEIIATSVFILCTRRGTFLFHLTSSQALHFRLFMAWLLFRWHLILGFFSISSTEAMLVDHLSIHTCCLRRTMWCDVTTKIRVTLSQTPSPSTLRHIKYTNCHHRSSSNKTQSGGGWMGHIRWWWR